MEASVGLYPFRFDKVIRDQGLPVKWSEAMFCYCITDNMNQPDYNCPVCKGKGFYYSDPKDTIVAVTNLSGKQDFLKEIGIIEAGTAYVTTLSTDLMGYNDRLLFPDFSSKYSQILTFKEGIDGRLVSSIFHKKIKNILKLIGPNTPEGGWIEDVHFKTSEDGFSLIWIDENIKPVVDTKFSALYVTSPTYLISDVIHELRGTITTFHLPQPKFVELPKQFMIRREDFSYASGY